MAKSVKDGADDRDAFQNVLDDALNEMEADGLEQSAAVTEPDDSGAEASVTTTDPAPDTGAPTAEQTATDAAAELQPDATAPAAAESEAAAPADDPFAGSKPLEYEFNGQRKVYDAIHVDDATGAGFMAPEEVAKVQGVFAFADQAMVNQERLTQRIQQLESTLEYKAGDTEYKGEQAFTYLRAEVERLNEGGTVLWKALNDPTFTAELAYARQQGDEATVQRLMGSLARDMKLGVLEAERRVGQMAAQPRAPNPEQQQQARTTAVANAVDVIARQYQGLTPDDVAEAKQVFGPLSHALVRAATAQDVARWPNSGFKVGDAIVDRPQMEQFFATRAGFRASVAKQTQDAQARATAAAKAQKHNSSMNATRQPSKGAGTPAAAPVRATDGARPSRTAAWTDTLDAALSDIGIPQ